MYSFITAYLIIVPLLSDLDGVDGPYTKPKIVTRDIPGPKSRALLREMAEFMVCFHFPNPYVPFKPLAYC